MNVRDMIAAIVLTVGVLLFALTTAGLLVARGLLDRIHYLAPGTLIGSVAITLAVLVHEGFTQAGVKAILIMILLVFSNPVLSHATARAYRIRRKHQSAPKPNEQIPFAKEQT
jgi:multicomponent Na+:H+ antiporter subunit G